MLLKNIGILKYYGCFQKVKSVKVFSSAVENTILSATCSVAAAMTVECHTI